MRDPLLLQLPILLPALADPGTCFILGSGASAPDVPLIPTLPPLLRTNMPLIGSWPAAPIMMSPVRQMIHDASTFDPSSIEDWRFQALTPSTLIVLLEQELASIRTQLLPQYKVFHLFSRKARIVSFNWDALAYYQAPQLSQEHVHGYSRRHQLPRNQLEELIDLTQCDEESAGEWVRSAPLVFPGEESQIAHGQKGKVASEIWRSSDVIVAIGYNFGMGGYDRDWLDCFVESMSDRIVPIHIISPNASAIVKVLQDKLRRYTSVFGYHLKWKPFAEALLIEAQLSRKPIIQLSVCDIVLEYQRRIERY